MPENYQKVWNKHNNSQADISEKDERFAHQTFFVQTTKSLDYIWAMQGRNV